MKDWITDTFWQTLCEHTYDGDNPEFPTKSCIVYVPLDRIVEFFYECEDSDLEFVVVSARSDYSLCYQKDYPVQADMLKWLDFINWQEEIVGYEDLIIKARCYKHQCNIRDKYSLRFYSWTGFTFNSIPKNVKQWYCTNCNVNHPLITKIPFGVPSWFVENYVESKEEKVNAIYANFQVNTHSRAFLRKQKEWDGIPIVHKENVAHKEYIEDLNKYKYILSPEGNGFDCYRNLEAVYCNSFPLIFCEGSNTWAGAYQELPTYNSLSPIKPLDGLEFSTFFQEFWKKELRSARNLL